LLELAAATRDGSTESLPDSVEALIAARIDRLGARDRDVVRRMSVLGRTFATSLLPAVVDTVPGPGDPLWMRVSSFVSRTDDEIAFLHALLRDGAYEGLPFRLRRELHANV